VKQGIEDVRMGSSPECNVKGTGTLTPS